MLQNKGSPQHRHFPPQNQARQVSNEIFLECLLQRKNVSFLFPLAKKTWTSPHSSPVACQEKSENDVVADQEDDLSNHNGNVMKAVMDL